jgi:hypothetical protein
VRAVIVKAFSWDDGWMIFAQLMHTMNSTCAIGGALTGTGRLMKDLTPHSMMMALRVCLAYAVLRNLFIDFILQFWWVCYMAYCLSMIGAKISVGLSLLRITPFSNRTYRWIIRIVMCTSVLTGCIFGLLTAFQCSPVRFFWGRALGETGKCISMDIIMDLTYVMSAIFAICDFTFAILPVFLIKGLNMSMNSKIALIPILSMAWMYVILHPGLGHWSHANIWYSASAAVLVRLAYVPTFKDPEFLYATVPIAIWSEVEMSFAITAGSLPTLRPLYRMVATKLRWKKSLFSNYKSYKSMEGGSERKGSGGVIEITNQPLVAHYSESKSTIVNVKNEDFVLAELRPVKQAGRMGITRVTDVQVEFDDRSKV